MREGGIVARGASRLPLIAAIGLAGAVFIRTAWLSDDAYITFRTVDNLVNGLGPVWNAAERVQAYTHPLWMLLLAAARLLTGEAYFSSIALGAVCSLIALALVGIGCARGPAAGALAVLVLAFSRAFVDYSTSGLENPLAHLLLAAFAALLVRGAIDERRLSLLALLAALGALTRPDLALLFAPGLLAAARPLPWRRALRALAVGALPLLAWEAFSLAYYGFPFPNTAYAKLGHGIAARELWAQGARYLLSGWRHDPTTAAVTVAGLIAAAARGDRWSRSLAAGAALYMVYVVAIGGDFMRGRFLAAPLLLASVCLARDRAAAARLAPAAAACLVAAAFLAPGVPALTGADYGDERAGACDDHGVCDERRFYYRATGLLRWRAGAPMPDSPYAEQGRALRREGSKATIVHRYVGFLGYTSGPDVHIIDEHGLADPLLARLPAVWSPQWRIGHFVRLVPAGYRETVASGQNRLVDPGLARYHDELARITRGPLFDRRRWASILGMNLGRFDRLVDRERYRFPGLAPLTLAEAAAPEPAPVPPESPDLTGLPTLGLRVDLGAISHAPALSLTLRGAGEHLFVYLRGDDVVAHGRAAVAGGDAAPGRVTLAVPAAAVGRGYDRLVIVPVKRSTPLGVSGLRLGQAS